MKKATAILIVLLTLLIVGCTPAEDPRFQTSQGHVFFSSESAYNEYIAAEAENLPSVFVRWEDISMLGNFKGFATTNHYYSYWYRFSDGHGDFTIYIDHAAADIKEAQKELSSVSSIVSTTGMASMRKVSCTDSVVIQRNGMSYYYVPTGSLISVHWFDKDTAYTLGGDLHDYPMKATSTFVGRLLSISETEASAAFAEIKQSLDAS